MSQQSNFQKCIQGYHMLNTAPISQAVWENINVQIYSRSGVEVFSQADGSHSSGMDINCSLGRISNKTAKYSNKTFDISSYRLTTACSESACGTADEIVAAINAKKNFDLYSFLVRDEDSPDQIRYDWYSIPSDHPAFNPAAYEWKPKIGKRGKKIETQVGWTTDPLPGGSSMGITFSMSSQLWIHKLNSDELSEFLVASCTVGRTAKYNYIDLVDLLP